MMDTYLNRVNDITNTICVLLLLGWLTGCTNGSKPKSDALHQDDTTALPVAIEPPTLIEVDCDSIYEKKGYRLRLLLAPDDGPSDYKDVVFTVIKSSAGQETEIYRDSIQGKVLAIKFEDFNNDGVKDILIQDDSDVRSNWTYHLYLVDIGREKFKKIKGFETIKNPHYLPEYDLIDNLVMSGRNWTSFYKIQGDSVKDFGIVVYDGENESGETTYEADYKKTIRTVLREGQKP